MNILFLLVLALASLVPAWSATPDPVIGTRTVTPKVTTVFTAGSVPFVSTNGILYQDNAKFFWDDTNFRLGLGTASPDARFHLNQNTVAGPAPTSGTGFHFTGADASTARVMLDSFGNSGLLTFRRASGTAASQTALANDDRIAALGISGYGATAYSSVYNSLGLFAGEAWTDAAQGFYVSLSTVPVGTVTSTERLRLTTEGNLLLNTTTSHGGKMEILYGAEQLRLSYDATHYSSETVNSSGNLTIAPSGGLMTVGTSSDVTVDTTNHRLGIGTASPSYAADVTGQLRTSSYILVSSSANQFALGSITGVNRIEATSTSPQPFVLYNTSNGYTGARMGRLSLGGTYAGSDAPSSGLLVEGTTLIGTTTSNGGKLEVLSTTEQIRASYDATHYAGMTVNSSGNLTIAQGTSGAVKWLTGAGSPESSVTASVGSLYTRTDGGAGTTLYVKESGTGNTGWVAK